MNTEETADEQKKAAYQTIGTDLTTLNSDVTTLTNPGFFNSRTTSVSNSSVANATAAAGTPLGNYTFKVTTLASDSVQVGATASGPLNSTSDVSSLVLANAGFANPVSAGTFTVNGQTITIATSDTLQSVFDQISTATGGAVTASYDATPGDPNYDEITLSNSDPSNTTPITLGSDTDTSNFLQSAELYNNGTNTVTSAAPLGGVNLSDSLGEANLATPITGDGSGNGEFTINGVPITFNTSTSTVTDVLQEINDSAAGVTATYDSLGNRFELTDTSPGNVGISLNDVTGNFLAATGLSGGTLQAGNNLEYSINGGGQLTSASNTIDAGSSGLTGLSVTAVGEGTTTISVNSDTSTISSAINSFVTDYNAVQNYISSQTATTTSSSGTVTPGLLTGDMDVEGIMTNLRQLVDASPGTTSGVLNLNELGIESNGNDNTLSISDPTTLSNALANNLTAVQNLFTNPTNGLATTLGSYIANTNSLTGTLASDENNMTTEIATLTTSISTLQTKISNDQTSLDQQFTDMETAINSINAEKEYLNDYFNSSGASDQSAPTAAGSGTSSG
jgi:flagellar hook-associated protein 2